MLGIYLRTAASVEKDSMQEVSFDVFQSPYIKYLQLISSFTWWNINRHSHWALHLKNFFLKIVRDITWFRKEISVKKARIIIKFNVNFLLMVPKYTISLAMSFIWKCHQLYYIFYYNKNVSSPFFVKLSFKTQFAGGFP